MATAGAPRQGADVLVASMPSAGLRWRRVFSGEERELTDLRRWLGMLLPEGGPRDDVVSVATELASNAIKHTASGRGGWFAVEIALAQPSSAVRVCVADSGAPGGPRMVDEPLAEHGRGLMLVQGLSARTGVSGDQRGRVVWADIPWPAAVAAQLPAPARDPFETAIRASQAELARHFGAIPIWFGRATMQWWALVVRPGMHQLVNAASPEALAVALVRALEAPLPLRVAASPAGGAGSRYHRDRRPVVAPAARLPGRGSLHRVGVGGHGPSTGPHPSRPGHAAATMARRAS